MYSPRADYPPHYMSALALHRSMKCAGTFETVHEVARRLWGPRPPCWIIDPRKSRRLGYWDALTTLCLLFTASVTPFEVALLPVAFDALFLLNRVVDAILLLDVGVQFITITAIVYHLVVLPLVSLRIQ